MSVFSYVDFFVFFKQKTAYEMRISDWSSDVCSSDLLRFWLVVHLLAKAANTHRQIGIFVIGRSVVAVEAIERGEYTCLDRDRSARAVIDLAHEVEARVGGILETAVVPTTAIAEHDAAGFLQAALGVGQLGPDQTPIRAPSESIAQGVEPADRKRDA